MITVATSITPFNIEKQKMTIKSWKNLGFSIISVNVEDEVNILKSEFQDVKFVVAQRDSRKINGKPLVYINDLLSELAKTDSSVCGILNSDISFRVSNGTNFINFINREVSGSFLFGSRINISDEQQNDGHEYSDGFDFFFFEKDNINIFENCNFCLGAPWWDYWLPLVPLLNNYNVKRLVSPVAFHVVHEERWSKLSWNFYGEQLGSYLNVFFKKNDVTKQFNSFGKLRKKTAFIWIMLRYDTEIVFFDDILVNIKSANISIAQYLDMKNELHFFRRKKHLKTSTIRSCISTFSSFLKYNFFCKM